ncbi:hypothetical protein [Tardiphaga sp.]|uniref:hypothetical protein n=1 Tax=Tardiphaga sp. TaxID=1926292 RepID=UPI00260C30F1|nr:hypothetical protein [Tardiphaga sp.]MDB5615881.1 hypothetical protein [Tardiphaga sp.]
MTWLRPLHVVARSEATRQSRKQDLTVMEVPMSNEVGPLLAGQAAGGVIYEPGA